MTTEGSAMSENRRTGIFHLLIDQFLAHLTRLRRLAEIHRFLEREDEGHRAIADEVRRASVVFLHAVFEDTFREYIRLKLSGSSPDILLPALERIPLAGMSSTGQPKKFSLVELHAYRGKTVDDVIQQSIDEFLDRKSFNSTNDIAGMLALLGVDISPMRQHFSYLDEMISRRHQIVHKADLEDTPSGRKPAPILEHQLVYWIAAASAFFVELIKSEAPPELHEGIEAFLEQFPTAVRKALSTIS